MCVYGARRRSLCSSRRRLRHLVQLLPVAALVDERTKHALLVLEKVGRRAELGLDKRVSAVVYQEKYEYELTMRPASSTS